MGLFFLVVCAVGILRPIKNALALDGLGGTDFYKVYIVSAVVILFVPAFTRAADRVAWRWLVPAVALFFATNLVVFRLLYVEGSAAFGLVFYGWYDLFAAALVTQFFMATQLNVNARTARSAYPLVIAGGSLGATLGGAITGFFAQAVGTPNLLLVAAALIILFSIGLPLVWGPEDAAAVNRGTHRGRHASGSAGPAPRAPRRALAAELRAVFGNRQVRLIAALVLITILVKQLVDYQFNALTKEAFSTRDAISAFQGKFNAATQWLPLVALAALKPSLRRWGVGAAVLLLPVAMLFTNIGLLLFWGVAAGAAAKGTETALRYSAERAGREILYVPVPDAIKLRAKAYVDVAVEKGLGKLASALLIFVLLQLMDYRRMAWVGLGLALLWFALAISVRREYVRTLARSIQGRYASVRGVFAGLVSVAALPAIRRALAGDDAGETAFALDLLAQGAAGDAAALAPSLRDLATHASPEVRRRALDLAARFPDAADANAVRAGLRDAEPAVREAAVRALCASADGGGGAALERLLAEDATVVRVAALACIARGEIAAGGESVARVYASRLGGTGPIAEDARVELAVAAGLLPADDGAARTVTALLDDPEPRVASAALRSAGRLGLAPLHERMVRALGEPALREAARDALAGCGDSALDALAAVLLDAGGPSAVRRNIPSVLARMPSARAVDLLLRAILAPETDQFLDYRGIRALSRLRSRHPELPFDAAAVGRLVEREAATAARYAEARDALADAPPAGPAGALLVSALGEAWEQRREGTFRCLGLLHPGRDTFRAYREVAYGAGARRTNALEWLEQTVGFSRFAALRPVLEGDARHRPRGLPDRELERLREDGDGWVATCAAAALAERRGGVPRDAEERMAMDVIERVLLLRQVDLLQRARSEHLGLLASVAEEAEAEQGETLLRSGEPHDALYVVIEGAVELSGVGERVRIEARQAFGTWMLVDDAPSLVEATALEPSRLLRITREDFDDLVADYPEIAIGLLQRLGQRVRAIVA